MFRKAVKFVKNKEKENMESNNVFQKKRGGTREGLFHYKGEELTFCSMARNGICKCEKNEF